MTGCRRDHCPREAVAGDDRCKRHGGGCEFRTGDLVVVYWSEGISHRLPVCGRVSRVTGRTAGGPRGPWRLGWPYVVEVYVDDAPYMAGDTGDRIINPPAALAPTGHDGSGWE